jgi:hypothetical protein
MRMSRRTLQLVLIFRWSGGELLHRELDECHQ